MNEGRTSYTVGQVPELAGVTVRALRYYDEIGLLPPSGRDVAASRSYAQYRPSAQSSANTNA